MHKDIDTLENIYSKKISIDFVEKKIFNHVAAYKIAGVFSKKIFFLCWYENLTEPPSYIDDKFKFNYQCSDCGFLMSWMIDDPALPCFWKEALLQMCSVTSRESVEYMKFSAVGILIVLNYFLEYMSAHYNYDLSPVIFFIRSMFFIDKNIEQGWNLFNQVLKIYRDNPKSEEFKEYEYHNDSLHQEQPLDTNNSIPLESFNLLANKLIEYGLKPTIDCA